MALVPEYGAATAASANTYCSMDYVNTYCNTTMGYSGFTGSSTLKERAMMRAMSYVEALPWKGIKEDEDNPLEWPRAGVIDRNNYTLDDDMVPRQVKKALAETTYREFITAKTLEPDLGRDETSSVSGVKRKKLDVLETEYFTAEERGIAYQRKKYTIIEGLLKGLIYSGGAISLDRG